MERNRNWQGWAALILAGLALVVALGGRGWGNQSMAWERSSRAVQVAPVAPAQANPAMPAQPNMPSQGHMQRGMMQRGMQDDFAFGRPMQHGPRGMNMGRGSHMFFPFGMLFGLTQLIGLGLLAWLLLRLFTQRRQSPPESPAGPPPTTPAGHDPRVE